MKTLTGPGRRLALADGDEDALALGACRGQGVGPQADNGIRVTLFPSYKTVQNAIDSVVRYDLIDEDGLPTADEMLVEE